MNLQKFVCQGYHGITLSKGNLPLNKRPGSLCPNSCILSSPENSDVERLLRDDKVSPLKNDSELKVQIKDGTDILDVRDISTTPSLASCQDFCLTMTKKVEPWHSEAKAPLQILSFLRAGQSNASTTA